MEKVLILASGVGTTAERFINDSLLDTDGLNVAGVVSNNSEAGVFERVEYINRLNNIDIPTYHISKFTHPKGMHGRFEQTDAESSAINELVVEKNCGYVVLLGYMRKVRGELLQQNVVNFHPGPLPLTQGMLVPKIQQTVIDGGYDFSALSFHEVDEDYDTGNLINAHEIPVLQGDSAQSLYERTHELELDVVYSDVKEYANQGTAR